MNYKTRRRLRVLKDYCIGWTFSFLFLSVVRGEGTRELGSVQFDLVSTLLYSFSIGPVIGLISGFGQILTEERLYGKMTFWRLVILRVLYAVIFLILLIVVSYFIVTSWFDLEISFLWFVIEPGSIAIYLYLLSVETFLIYLRLVKLMIGESQFSQLVSGKFYNPREVERIFMFLDLQSSTHIAEQLGHIQYSRFLQDCFNDISIVAENGAEFYQYVGDEVVLTWHINDGLTNQNCLNAYFNIKEAILKRKQYYLERYGTVPFFKAGMHGGKVTVAEVGIYKKDIAYHGDPVNTAARIQSQCNFHKQEFLISSDLKNILGAVGYDFLKIGEVVLRGKDSKVEIWAVSQGI